MVEKHLPDGADIHGGGTDLRFPHHENELAQSTGAHPDHTFVRAWAHHGMVNFADTGKMAKSLGNILDVERAIDLHGPNALRMWLLQSHYSQPIDYSEEILEEKRRSYERLLRLYRQISGSETSSELSERLANELRERFDAAMRDDFNTPEAVATLFEAAHYMGQEIAARPETVREFATLRDVLQEVLDILGFDLEEDVPVYAHDQSSIREIIDEIAGTKTADILEKEMRENGRINLTTAVGRTVWIERGSREGMPSEEVTLRVQVRRRARQIKDWAAADKLRESVRAEGWEIEDTPGDPILSRR
jgi:cysteinyl-tRNA synthetase